MGTRGVITVAAQNTSLPSCQATKFFVSPSPIVSDSKYGVATLVGDVSCAYDIRVGQPGGALFVTGTKGTFSATTNKWVNDGLVFYLQVHGNNTSSGTLAVATAKVRSQNTSTCTAQNFAASPNPIRTNGPYGETTLTGSAGCAFDIRVNAPNGALFASGEHGDFAVRTGKWVAQGMTFYLQAHGDTTEQGTLAIVTANVLPSGPTSCTAASFSASPNPIRTNEKYGNTTLTGTVDCAYDIRLGSPEGALFASGEKGNISAATGFWVSDGLSFYLQEKGDTTAQGTLAVVTTRVQSKTTAPSCDVSAFGFTSSPILATGVVGAATLTGTVGCDYEIRVGNPAGALFARGARGPINVKTGNWVTDGMIFYLQRLGITTSEGTLSVAVAKIQPGPSTCNVDSFSALPIRGTGFYGATTLSGSVRCAYEIHVASPDGPSLRREMAV